ncbi:MAG: hypothetical protein WBD24_02680, partial [Candidatus Omnitrophota bacterium]
DKFIALHNDFIDDPVAVFHEAIEYMFLSGQIRFEYKGIIAWLIHALGLKRFFRWTDKIKGELIIKDSGGKVIGQVPLTGDALAIALKGKKSPHYLARALQRVFLKRHDPEFTEYVKAGHFLQTGKIKEIIKRGTIHEKDPRSTRTAKMHFQQDLVKAISKDPLENFERIKGLIKALEMEKDPETTAFLIDIIYRAMDENDVYIGWHENRKPIVLSQDHFRTFFKFAEGIAEDRVDWTLYGVSLFAILSHAIENNPDIKLSSQDIDILTKAAEEMASVVAEDMANIVYHAMNRDNELSLSREQFDLQCDIVADVTKHGFTGPRERYLGEAIALAMDRDKKLTLRPDHLDAFLGAFELPNRRTSKGIVSAVDMSLARSGFIVSRPRYKALIESCKDAYLDECEEYMASILSSGLAQDPSLVHEVAGAIRDLESENQKFMTLVLQDALIKSPSLLGKIIQEIEGTVGFAVAPICAAVRGGITYNPKVIDEGLQNIKKFEHRFIFCRSLVEAMEDSESTILSHPQVAALLDRMRELLEPSDGEELSQKLARMIEVSVLERTISRAFEKDDSIELNGSHFDAMVKMMARRAKQEIDANGWLNPMNMLSSQCTFAIAAALKKNREFAARMMDFIKKGVMEEGTEDGDYNRVLWYLFALLGSSFESHRDLKLDRPQMEMLMDAVVITETPSIGANIGFGVDEVIAYGRRYSSG